MKLNLMDDKRKEKKFSIDPVPVLTVIAILAIILALTVKTINGPGKTQNPKGYHWELVPNK